MRLIELQSNHTDMPMYVAAEAIVAIREITDQDPAGMLNPQGTAILTTHPKPIYVRNFIQEVLAKVNGRNK